MTRRQQPKVLTTPEVAELLGWSEEYVRKGMKRYGIERVEGWPEDEVLELLARQQQAQKRG